MNMCAFNDDMMPFNGVYFIYTLLDIYLDDACVCSEYKTNLVQNEGFDC